MIRYFSMFVAKFSLRQMMLQMRGRHELGFWTAIVVLKPGRKHQPSTTSYSGSLALRKFKVSDYLHKNNFSFNYSLFHVLHILSVFTMPDKREAGKPKIEEAIVGVKADVKSLQQISSSGRAAQRKREANHAQKGFRALDEAFERHLEQGDKGEPRDKPGQ
ncbi:hypothetical protein Pdw03_5615 [Penicillium digitatum]|uniref:Uncharacterized protein n=1 Tax=Penicillium digitatum TaxID=36651 RepID=A0A7T6XVD9_PENDI|nr:hypothetical protein Pdw03_5615 [Penicillium digitatum]